MRAGALKATRHQNRASVRAEELEAQARFGSATGIPYIANMDQSRITSQQLANSLLSCQSTTYPNDLDPSDLMNMFDAVESCRENTERCVVYGSRYPVESDTIWFVDGQ